MILVIFVNWHYREKPRPHKSGYFWNHIYIHFSQESAFRLVFRPRAKPVNPLTETLGWFSNRTGTSVDDGKARGKDWTRLPVLNLLLCHWSSQLFDLRVSSSTDVPVLLLNQPTISWQRESARKGLNAIFDAQFAALPLVKPVVWFARVVVNWRSRSIAKSA